MKNKRIDNERPRRRFREAVVCSDADVGTGSDAGTEGQADEYLSPSVGDDHSCG